ncbi:unnamed protein product [Peniophora sp. CBMAI 1063]|nr:unnamed protein product [Peniophora sp. CBMAI 1063]
MSVAHPTSFSRLCRPSLCTFTPHRYSRSPLPLPALTLSFFKWVSATASILWQDHNAFAGIRLKFLRRGERDDLPSEQDVLANLITPFQGLLDPVSAPAPAANPPLANNPTYSAIPPPIANPIPAAASGLAGPHELPHMGRGDFSTGSRPNTPPPVYEETAPPSYEDSVRRPQRSSHRAPGPPSAPVAATAPLPPPLRLHSVLPARSTATPSSRPLPSCPPAASPEDPAPRPPSPRSSSPLPSTRSPLSSSLSPRSSLLRRPHIRRLPMPQPLP